MSEEDQDPQAFLSQLFAARHELLTIKTMAEQGGEIIRRAITLTRFAPPEGLEHGQMCDLESTVPALTRNAHRIGRGTVLEG